MRSSLESISKIIGVIHLLPLPGSPKFSASIGAILERAIEDCNTYHDSGVESAIIENFGDAPFAGGRVPAATISSIALIAHELIRQFPTIRFGINVLRNDAESALSIAEVVGAKFIRVNVHVGAVVADQGIIQGKAYETLRLRKNLNSGVKIFADVGVKHSAQLGDYELRHQAADALERGLADAIIITGARTGAAVDLRELQELRTAFPNAKIIIGSGATAANARKLLKHADGIIVGTSVKVDGVTSNPADGNRVKEFVKAALS
ncbi:MAG: BtpA/SgcQ family protein [Candidatus Kryptoniota bacterium]